MSHFARIIDGVVTEVLVIEQDIIDTGAFGNPDSFVQTSYNTREGIYYTPNTNIPDPDQSKSLRKNYAGIGYTYDPDRDAFIPPKPFPSWLLDENTCQWQPPIAYPDDGNDYYWNEEFGEWVLVNLI